MKEFTTYKGVKIEIDEKTGTFQGWIDGDPFTAKTLDELKGKLDSALKKEFKRIPVFKRTTRYSEPCYWKPAQITSVNKETVEAWITDANKDRSKESFRFGSSNIEKDTPENRKLVEEINNLVSERERLEKEITARQKRLTMVSGKDFGYDPK